MSGLLQRRTEGESDGAAKKWTTPRRHDDTLCVCVCVCVCVREGARGGGGQREARTGDCGVL